MDHWKSKTAHFRQVRECAWKTTVLTSTGGMRLSNRWRSERVVESPGWIWNERINHLKYSLEFFLHPKAGKLLICAQTATICRLLFFNKSQKKTCSGADTFKLFYVLILPCNTNCSIRFLKFHSEIKYLWHLPLHFQKVKTSDFAAILCTFQQYVISMRNLYFEAQFG